MARQFSLVAQMPPIMLLPLAADAAGRASPFRSLRNALKAYIVVRVNQGNAATVLLSLFQATNVAGAASKALGAVPIWTNLNTAINDSYARVTPNAVSFTTDAGVFDKCVIFEIQPEACMDVANGFDCIGMSTGASNVANITGAELLPYNAIQSALPPNSYVDL
jgi:hypothetical protein